MDQQSPYDALDTPTLQNLLLNADQPPDVHRGALSALARRGPYQRSQIAASIMRSVLRHPDRYDQDVMMSVIEILATDPEAEATVAMLNLLPDMLATGMDSSRGDLKPEFREYFYQALVTRQRVDDIEVWREMLPQLDAKTLVAAMLDPAAKPLEALEPLTLIERLEEPQRTKALISIIVGVIRTKGDPNAIQQATRMLADSAAPEQLQEGVNILSHQWEKAKKAGKRSQLELLEATLRLLDREPRTPAERLIGKRPWAQ
jgi:hypothetical protein